MDAAYLHRSMSEGARLIIQPVKVSLANEERDVLWGFMAKRFNRGVYSYSRRIYGLVIKKTNQDFSGRA